jgi:F-type H+-transporting ATPase subunit epsilon
MPLKVEIITAERELYSDDVDMVIAPGVEGQLGILPHHAPLMTMLGPGELRLKKGNEEIVMVATGGFMEVMADRVVILADAAERAEDIDISRAEAARRRAEERLHQHASDIDLARAEAALKRALVRLRVAEKRRRRTRPPSGSGGM